MKFRIADRSQRIAIFLSSLGGGHQSVASALRDALLQQNPDLQVDLIDVFSQCSRFPLTKTPSLYNLFTARWPFLWRTLYAVTNSTRCYTMAEGVARPFVQQGLDRCVVRGQYDVLVTVFPALGHALARAAQRTNWRPRLIAVVIDLVTIHAAWICNQIDRYIVATPEARQACQDWGISPECVEVLGLPIRREFTRSSWNSDTARLHLGLLPDLFTVLILGGGEGVGQIPELARALIERDDKMQVLVVAGRNRQLFRPLQMICQLPRGRWFGYVEDILPLMVAADLIVTKAGPCTIAEAVACQRPLLITGHLPQEAGNVRYVCQNELGWASRDVTEACAKILVLAKSDGTELQRVRQRAGQLAWHHAADNTAERILSCSS